MTFSGAVLFAVLHSPTLIVNLSNGIYRQAPRCSGDGDDDFGQGTQVPVEGGLWLFQFCGTMKTQFD